MREKRSDRYNEIDAAIEDHSDAEIEGESNHTTRTQAAAEAKEARKNAIAGKLWLCVLVIAMVGLVFIAVSAAQSVQDAPNPTLQIAEPTPTPSATPRPSGAPSEAPTPTPEPTPKVMIPEMAELKAQNEDLAAWVKIDGTVIDYPVMFTPNDGEDGQFYLYRNFEKEEDPTKQGCVFIDVHDTIDPRSTNLLLHGHNMRRGTMFHTLVEYEDIDFWREHPTIKFTTLYDQEEYEIVYAFRSRVYNEEDEVFKYYKFVNATTPAEFQAFIDGCKELALYDTGIVPEFGDEFLTLNTCEYTQENGRMVVVARKIKSDEERLQSAIDAQEAPQPATMVEPEWTDGITVSGDLH